MRTHHPNTARHYCRERLDPAGRGGLAVTAGAGAVRLLRVTGGDLAVHSTSGDIEVELPVPGFACQTMTQAQLMGDPSEEEPSAAAGNATAAEASGGRRRRTMQQGTGGVGGCLMDQKRLGITLESSFGSAVVSSARLPPPPPPPPAPPSSGDANATAAAVAAAAIDCACACDADGIVDALPTGRGGCARHDATLPGTFCHVSLRCLALPANHSAGHQVAAASASVAFPGTAQRPCAPDSAVEQAATRRCENGAGVGITSRWTSLWQQVPPAPATTTVAAGAAAAQRIAEQMLEEEEAKGAFWDSSTARVRASQPPQEEAPCGIGTAQVLRDDHARARTHAWHALYLTRARMQWVRGESPTLWAETRRHADCAEVCPMCWPCPSAPPSPLLPRAGSPLLIASCGWGGCSRWAQGVCRGWCQQPTRCRPAWASMEAWVPTTTRRTRSG